MLTWLFCLKHLKIPLFFKVPTEIYSLHCFYFMSFFLELKKMFFITYDSIFCKNFSFGKPLNLEFSDPYQLFVIELMPKIPFWLQILVKTHPHSHPVLSCTCNFIVIFRSNFLVFLVSCYSALRMHYIFHFYYCSLRNIEQQSKISSTICLQFCPMCAKITLLRRQFSCMPIRFRSSFRIYIGIIIFCYYFPVKNI